MPMFNLPFEIAIRGCGHATGTRCYSNADVMEEFGIRIKTSFIDNNVGSETRYFLAEDMSTSDLATRAAEKALAAAGLEVQQLSRLIVATSTADYLSPSTACVVQHKLGGSGFPAYDLGAACSGFVYALDQAIRCVATGDEHVLVVGVDARSRTLDRQNKRTAFLYGDGAGAVVISRNRRSGNGFIASLLYADGSGHDAVYVPSVGHARDDDSSRPVLTMPNGRRVSENAGPGIPYLCNRLLDESGYRHEDIAFYLFHQPNLFLLRSALNELRIPDHKTVINFPRYGNTVAASIPIALSEAVAERRLQPDDLVLMCAVGGGFTGGVHLLRWCDVGDFAP